MKKTLTLIAILVSLNTISQVPQTVLIEHFTNTRCSVCASRNPGLYQNIGTQQPSVLHIAFHPSAPYSACILNQHNKVENDARTNYYGVYGSTPRIVIQGNTIGTGVDYSSSNLFSSYVNNTTPIDIVTSITKAGDSIIVRAIVKAVTSHGLSNLLVAGFLVEEELPYAAPNGEQTHHDVFRKGLFSMSGESFICPANNDSILFERKVAIDPIWNLAEMYAIITVTNQNKQAVQSSRTAKLTTPTSLNTRNKDLTVMVFPNPAASLLNIALEEMMETQIALYDLSGRKIYTQQFQKQLQLSTIEFKSGIYFLEISNAKGLVTRKIQIVH
ncbi:MAG: T9SS type A sorting domain-containing protein [Bacteroidia bacterium]|jgi:hypothetical protein|nr:T9SS type A sorting domain-containing protein [Bacteroidia bacterium]